MAEVLEALPLYLTKSEIDGMFMDMRKPITQNAARIRYLRSLGLHVKISHDGSPHVARTEYERVMGAARIGAKPVDRPPGSSPDIAATAALPAARKPRHGSKA